ncbi:hypothetical protein HanIR_Chr02g0071861 [Helianthus annuus]|nr:hypothetical protein HanIR_Chr02g0071861 [Helianthus annuus]
MRKHIIKKYIESNSYILHNANFYSLVKFRTKIPFPKEATEWERVFDDSVSV